MTQPTAAWRPPGALRARLRLCLQARAQVAEHVLTHGVQVELVSPAPVGAGARVVQRAGPAVRDGLAKVGLVVHLKARHDLGAGEWRVGESGDAGPVRAARHTFLIARSSSAGVKEMADTLYVHCLRDSRGADRSVAVACGER